SGGAKVSAKYVRYLKSGDEVFARAYSQYIATKTKNTGILKHIKRITDDDHIMWVASSHWTTVDFKKVLKRFDDLFDTL
ncbi:hypothetical protein N8Z76_00265, partial [Gammaproteobacteria bacterium]|nr:hypothetical protein [Gammaproteobacteria bacterium]